ncbi:MAG: DUF423 domain-containing protein [Planctomycetes bacterium]|nr:DUF423 domain-containing protein [Planctomycetota bacterium]
MSAFLKSWLAIGATLAGLAVVTGAFAAHGIDDFCAEKYKDAGTKSIAGWEIPVSWKRLQDFKTAAEYQMYHALGLIVVGLLSQTRKKKSLQTAGWSFLGGIVLFSGSLYVLTLTGQTWWGAVTPFGGMLFLVGWVALAVGTCPCGETNTNE